MDDFYLVAGCEGALVVAAARHDFAIDFDGHATCAKAGLFEQVRQGRRCVDLAFVAVEKDLHFAILNARGSEATFLARFRIATHRDVGSVR